MTARRAFLMFGAAIAALPALAQAPRKAVIALVLAGRSGEDDSLAGLFIDEMRRRGWVEGRTAVFTRFATEGSRERADAAARAAIQAKPDLVFATTGGGVVASMRATRTTPIVFVMVSDPIASGMVASLRQPGRNATGVFQMGAEAISKRYELAHEALPHVRRFGVLLDSRAADYEHQRRQHEEAPKPKGVSVISTAIASFDEVPAALDRLKKEGAAVLVLGPSFTLTSRKREVISAAIERRMVPVGYRSDWADAGALLSFGADLAHVLQRSAEIADRLLRGGRPEDTPVEQASKFELIVNLRTAKALGITVPKAVLLRSDRVIE